MKSLSQASFLVILLLKQGQGTHLQKVAVGSKRQQYSNWKEFFSPEAENAQSCSYLMDNGRGKMQVESHYC